MNFTKIFRLIAFFALTIQYTQASQNISEQEWLAASTDDFTYQSSQTISQKNPTMKYYEQIQYTKTIRDTTIGAETTSLTTLTKVSQKIHGENAITIIETKTSKKAIPCNSQSTQSSNTTPTTDQNKKESTPTNNSEDTETLHQTTSTQIKYKQSKTNNTNQTTLQTNPALQALQNFWKGAAIGLVIVAGVIAMDYLFPNKKLAEERAKQKELVDKSWRIYEKNIELQEKNLQYLLGSSAFLKGKKGGYQKNLTTNPKHFDNLKKPHFLEKQSKTTPSFFAFLLKKETPFTPKTKEEISIQRENAIKSYATERSERETMQQEDNAKPIPTKEEKPKKQEMSCSAIQEYMKRFTTQY